MECKECKIVCNEKEIATINCTEDGINVKCTEDGKNFCKEFIGKESKGCC